MRKNLIVLTLAFTFLGLLGLLGDGLALAHGGHPHVMGTVAAIAADHLEVKTKDGKTVSVPLTRDTKYLRGDQPAAPADVRTGERVVVHLGAQGTAAEVHLGAAKAAPHAHSGH